MIDIPITIKPMIPMDIKSGDMDVTPAAIARVKEMDSKFIRLIIESGGCSGYQYKFSIDEPATNDDYTVEVDGITLVVDSDSLRIVAGSTVDFTSDIMSSQFVVNNPNSTGTCGCGVSFTC